MDEDEMNINTILKKMNSSYIIKMTPILFFITGYFTYKLKSYRINKEYNSHFNSPNNIRNRGLVNDFILDTLVRGFIIFGIYMISVDAYINKYLIPSNQEQISKKENVKLETLEEISLLNNKKYIVLNTNNDNSNKKMNSKLKTEFDNSLSSRDKINKYLDK
jgi:hypothetical protein